MFKLGACCGIISYSEEKKIRTEPALGGLKAATSRMPTRHWCGLMHDDAQHTRLEAKKVV